MVIGSPPCTMFSSLQNLSKGKRNKAEFEKAMKGAKEHVKFCLEIYKMQMYAGRYFLREHPDAASSWNMLEVVDLVAHADVNVVTCDMCAYGLKVTDKSGEALVEKRTKLMSNPAEVLKRVGLQCKNRTAQSEGEKHRHADTTCGRAKKCQVYPKEFCRAVCAGIAAQKRLRNLGLTALPLMSLSAMASMSTPSEDLHESGNIEAYDDLTGAEIDPALMKEARREEIKFFRGRKVYEKVDVAESWKVTGAGPIGVRWVDINKGDSTNPKYRSRLVAKEFNTGVRPDLYAATPPSECY